MENKSPNPHFNSKNIIAVGISLMSLFIIAYVSIFSLNCSGDKPDYDFISKSVIPVVGTWMGTILAFYFTRENFQAATDQYNRVLDRLTPEQVLSKTFAKDIMTPLHSIIRLDYLILKDRSIITEILRNQNNASINRFLFFDGYKCKYIIHRSTFDSYLLDKHDGVLDISTLTLIDFIEEKDIKYSKYVKEGIVFIREEATLLEAKILFDNNPNSQDIIVTKSGKADEDVIGLVTNNKLTEFLKA
jgi:hypothetical protein